MRRLTDLILYKTYADLKSESERTYVGFLWWAIEPVIAMAVYYVVFELVFQRDVPNYVTFLFVGLVPWRWFNTAVMRGANSIIGARGLIQQVYVPKAVFPLTNFVVDTIKFLVVLLLVLIVVRVGGFPIGAAYLALPLLLLVQGLFIVSLTLLIAAVAPFLPDVRIVIENVMRLLFFLSGVFYDIGDMSPRMQAWFRINPMTTVIESYRNILMHDAWPAFGALAVITVLSLMILTLGVWLLRRLDFAYAKIAL